MILASIMYGLSGFIYVVIILFVFLPVNIYAIIFNKRNDVWYQNFCYSLFKMGTKVIVPTLNLNIEIYGEENLITNKKHVLVSNHQSNLDITVLINIIESDYYFITPKLEMKKVPILNYLMKEVGWEYMDRKNPRAALKTINKGIDKLNKDRSVLIFPEGTRSQNTNELLEFKTGALRMAQKANAAIQPIVLIDMYKGLEGRKKYFKRQTVQVHILEEYKYDSLISEKELRDDLEKIYRDKIKELTS